MKKKKEKKIELLEVESKQGAKKSEKSDDFIEVGSSNRDIEIIKDLLPVVQKGKALVPLDDPASTDGLRQYIKEISRYKLLDVQEEKALIKSLQETGDIEAAKKLVMGNLRLVVKIAMEYRNAYKNVMDLIQEGNMGLMKAVSMYNPEKGAKLSYYASWWIKSYILKFILDNFRLIKVGTTADQKKLFYHLMREKERLLAQGIEPATKLLSQNLDVPERTVREMDARLSASGAELSLDTPLSSDGGGGSIQDLLASPEAGVEDFLAEQQGLQILEKHLQGFVQDLKPRDREIFKKRLLSEIPPSLQSIADDYGVSRERIRQIEVRLLEKLKVYMSEYIR